MTSEMPPTLSGAIHNAENLPPTVDIDYLLERYELLLLDAYGVLLNQQGPLPGAVNLIARLNEQHHHYSILTNSASHLPEAFARDLQHIGLQIESAQIITSGSMVARYFSTHNLSGSRCVVLGPENSAEYVRRAGGVISHWREGGEVVVIADQAGFPLLETLNGVITMLLHRLDRGEETHLVLCNPDRIYPVANQSYGITAGSIAHLIEGVLQERYPEAGYQFSRLGKPYTPIFDAAIGNHAKERCIMIGDQLGTDILGAQRSGIDSALVLSGLSQNYRGCSQPPTYLLPDLLA